MYLAQDSIFNGHSSGIHQSGQTWAEGEVLFCHFLARSEAQQYQLHGQIAALAPASHVTKVRRARWESGPYSLEGFVLLGFTSGHTMIYRT